MAPKIAVAPAPTPAATPAAPATGTAWRQRASHFFCLLLLFGFPIFSVPCQKGTCASPLEVVATYGYVKNLFSEELTKAVLYPASLMLKMEVLMGDEPQSFQLPEWDGLLSSWNLSASLVEEEKTADRVHFSLIPNFLSMFEANRPQNLNWEFVGACVICLLGGVFSMIRPTKVSSWGVLLVLWYIFIEGGKRKDVYAQPMFALAVACSLGWVNFKQLFAIPKEEKSNAADTESNVEAKKNE